jgi:prolyl 4-hydroxylase
MSVETNDGMLPASSVDREILIPGLVVYKNVIPMGQKVIDDLEGVLVGGSNYKWSQATVGNRQRMIDYRDCLDFKFKKSNIVGTDEKSETIKESWQYLYDRMNAAVEDYTKLYPMEKLEYWESINLIKYYPGNHFQSHADDGSSYKSVVSLVGYLNDDYEGGELSFDAYNIKIKPQAGDLVIFPSNFMFIHKAWPVIEGIKYSIVTMLDYSDKFHTQRFYYGK